MGNQLKISQMFNDFKNQTANHTYDQLKQKVHLINSVFQQTHQKLGLNIHLTTSSIRFQSLNWKKSTVKGTVSVETKIKAHLNEQQTTQKPKDNIILSYEDINTLYEQMKNLNHVKSTPKIEQPNQHQNRQSFTPEATSTGTANSNTISEPDQCCICFQKTPSMVLPCSHAFCDNCTVKYIIEAQEKKCPQCRHEIKGSRQSVEKQIFTVIQDVEVFQQVKVDVLNVLRNMNARIVKNIEKSIENQ